MTDNEQDNRVDLTPYQAAGGLEGLTKLVDEFYLNMDTLPEARTIRNMHAKDLTEARKKLTYFLSAERRTRDILSFFTRELIVCLQHPRPRVLTPTIAPRHERSLNDCFTPIQTYGYSVSFVLTSANGEGPIRVGPQER